jgi:hypothetical protein
MMEGLNWEEIKRCIKSALGSVPPDAIRDVHPLMRPDDDFVEMVSVLNSSSSSSSSSFFVFLFA